MSQPDVASAGWYPDPTVPGSHRYWDGAAWRDLPPRRASKLRSPLAWIGLGFLVLGFVPLVSGAPAVTLLLDLPALVLGIIATARPASRSWLAIVVLCLSAVGVIGNGIASAAPTGSAYHRATIEQSILSGANKQPGINFKTVQCPASPTFGAGDSFDCVATNSNGTSVLIHVKVQDDNGSYVWQSK